MHCRMGLYVSWSKIEKKAIPLSMLNRDILMVEDPALIKHTVIILHT